MAAPAPAAGDGDGGGGGAAGHLVFQLGTNNWQRQGEAAPGSGILHESHHRSMNSAAFPGTVCYSMFPSRRQTDPDPETEPDARFRVFHLEGHDIPIAESVSPVSSYRWHGMDADTFTAYRERMEQEVFDYMAEAERREGREFTLCIAHHSFLNPVVMRNVLRRRGKDTPLFAFVHGTCLKMFKKEVGGQEPDEFPLRFHPWIVEQGTFGPPEAGGVTGGFAISSAQQTQLLELFPDFPPERVIISPNGVNQLLFHPREETSLQTLLAEHKPLWPVATAENASEDVAAVVAAAACTRAVVFVGKFADWKRLDAVLRAASLYETTLPDVCTVILGSGPNEDVAKYHNMAAELNLQRTVFLGPKPQPVLADFFSFARVGVFPSLNEPFGMVFIEAMACGTPVIGCASGGPMDFVTEEVGTLLPEPEDSYDHATLGAALADAITTALNDDWKASRGDACVRLATEKYSTEKQVTDMLAAVDAMVAGNERNG